MFVIEERLVTYKEDLQLTDSNSRCSKILQATGIQGKVKILLSKYIGDQI